MSDPFSTDEVQETPRERIMVPGVDGSPPASLLTGPGTANHRPLHRLKGGQLARDPSASRTAMARRVTMQGACVAPWFVPVSYRSVPDRSPSTGFASTSAAAAAASTASCKRGVELLAQPPRPRRSPDLADPSCRRRLGGVHAVARVWAIGCRFDVLSACRRLLARQREVMRCHHQREREESLESRPQGS